MFKKEGGRWTERPKTMKEVGNELLKDNKDKIEWSKVKADYVRKGYVYYIQLRWKDTVLYKIGYTSFKDVRRRMEGMLIPIGCEVEVIEVIEFKHLARAKVCEALLHDRFRKYRFNGGNVIGNGWTELYVRDVREVEREGF